MPIMIIGHRGIHNKHMENSMESFKEIFNHKNNNNISYGLEFDIQPIQNGELVCYHDRTLDRLHNDNRKISELSMDDINTLNIPKFDDILKTFKDTNYILDVEIKSYSLTDNDIIDISKNVIDLIIKYNMENQCIITSFDENILTYLLKISHKIKCYLIINENLNYELISCLIKNNMRGIVINKNIISKLKDIVSNNLEIMVYTFYNKEDENENDNKIINNIKNIPDIFIITDNVPECERILFMDF